MKEKLLTLAVGLVVGAFAMYLTCGGGATVSADCPDDPGKACGNGDVNGDGAINVADAVYILGYLFAKGSAPEPFEFPPCNSCCPSGRLPATGQTQCYGYVQDQGWVAVPCDGT